MINHQEINHDKLNELKSFPIVNESNLEKLRKSTANNPQYLEEIFKSFIDDSRELIDEMDHSLGSNDFRGYYNAVHSLKGLAGTIGFSRMFQLLKMMDSHNKEEKFLVSASLINPLKEILSEVEELIHRDIIKGD